MARATRPAWTGVDWRAHQRWVPVGCRAVNVVCAGEPEGEAVVFVHGVDGCWTDWLEQLAALLTSRRVVALDLPGFGWSEPGSEPVTIPGYARCVQAVCDALGVDRAVLAGHSLGGVVAAELALRAPDRVAGLALVAPALYWRDQPGARRLVLGGRMLERWSDWSSARWRFALQRPRARRGALGRAVAHPERLAPETAYEMLKPVGTAAALREALRALWEHDLRQELELIEAPALVAWGAEDRLISPRFAQRVASALPHARLELFADTGHCPQIEAPERFNQLLEETLLSRR